jgi:hypothetical protein
VDVIIDLPDDLIAEIDSFVGAENRNAFSIAAAAERLRLHRALDMAHELPDATPEVDETSEDPPSD